MANMQVDLTSSKIDRTHEHIKKYQTLSRSDISLASHAIIACILGVVTWMYSKATPGLLNTYVASCDKFAAN